MTFLPSFLKDIGFDGTTARDQILIDQSVMDHIRNGRGFWPVITVRGIPQVVRFSVQTTTPPSPTTMTADHPRPIKHGETDRWTPATGSIDLVPLHALPVSDWPHVRMVG